MARIPKGTIVKVDLWNTDKNEGLIKYFTDTMELMRSRSKYALNKGDLAIVIDAKENFTLIIPKNQFTDVVEKWHASKRVNKKKLISLIQSLLKEAVKDKGGILSLNELWDAFNETPLMEVLTKKQLTKIIDSKNSFFDVLKENDVVYVSLKPEECQFDEIEIIKYAANHPYITHNMIKKDLKWSNVRINRIIEHLINKGFCHTVKKLPEGIRLYFQK